MTAPATAPGAGSGAPVRATAPGADGAARRRPAGGGVRLVLAELGVLALALGTAAGFSRLFVGWGFLADLAVPVALCWAVNLLLRRARLGVGPSVLLGLAAGVVVLTWRFAPGTSFLGVPTPTTVDVLAGELRSSFGAFGRLVAPVPATPGFLVVLAGSLWVFGLFADAAAFRYRAPVQAAVPYASAFVATGVLARESGRWAAAAWFGAGLVAYAATQRGWQAGRRRWIRGDGDRGARSVLVAGASTAAVALLAGLVAGPLLPGGPEPVLDLRELGRDGGSRTVVSPFVSVRSLLGERSDDVLFTVTSDRSAYWRLTALERYDPGRDIWTSRRSYQRADGALGRRGPAPERTERVEQEVRIAALGGLWLPAAFQAEQVDTDEDISWDAGSASLIARGDALGAGAGYRVTSALPDLDAAALSGTAEGSGLGAEYTSGPPLSDSVLLTASSVTAGAATPYEQAVALQDFFRAAFVYDEGADYRDEPDATAAFLEERRGFCQQFASTFALMARTLGLPARVAVGFTPGDAVPDVRAATTGVTDGPDRPGYVVRGRHAHAWPEVWFDDVGWVPFEPTPGRGNPQATQYTGVAPEQAASPPEQAATTTTPAETTTTAPGAPPDPAAGAPAVDATADDRAEPDGGPGGGTGWWVAVALLAVAVLSAAVVVRSMHRRRAVRRLGDAASGRVATAWSSAVEWVGVLGVSPRAEETPWEFAERVGRDLPDLERDRQLAVLAAAETRRRYAGVVPGAGDVAAAEAAAAEVVERARELSTRTSRLQRLVR